MPLNPDIAEVVAALAAAGPPIETVAPEVTRARMRAAPRLSPPRSEVAQVSDRVVEGPDRGAPVRIYRPVGTPLGVAVYLHGGGWVLGDLDSSDSVARPLAARAQCTVVSVDYRLAPEHPFPAGLDDAWQVLNWADENRAALAGPGAPLAVIGDSAGANLAASVALRWGLEDGPPLALQALLYPALDPTCESASHHDLAEGPVLTRAAMQWFWRQYAPDLADWGDPRLSPAYARDLARAPAAFVQTAEFDPLRDEGEAYARRLAEAGVPTQVTREAGLPHGFASLAALAPSADAALDHAAAALRQALVAAGG